MSKKLINFVDISKSYGNNLVLDELNLYIRENEFITLLGPSGCGKTTTLRILGGFETPDKGQVIFDDVDITSLPPNKRNLNTVFQKYALFPHMSIAENIAFGLKINKKSKEYINDKIKYALKLVNLDGFENRSIDSLSGGQQQRIAIARAIVNNPAVLIADEPTTALDVTIQAQILKLLKDLQKEFNYTIVFITHDLGVVANIADRVAVLYAGQVVELGTVEEVFYDPRHPYTWALLSSLPQLAQRNTKLYSISGTPPSLYNKIVGDPFAPRNPHCLKIDTLKEPPMFKVTETHYAKTWLLDPRAPKVEKPEAIDNIHEKLINAFNI